LTNKNNSPRPPFAEPGLYFADWSTEEAFFYIVDHLIDLGAKFAGQAILGEVGDPDRIADLTYGRVDTVTINNRDDLLAARESTGRVLAGVTLTKLTIALQSRFYHECCSDHGEHSRVLIGCGYIVSPPFGWWWSRRRGLGGGEPGPPVVPSGDRLMSSPPSRPAQVKRHPSSRQPRVRDPDKAQCFVQRQTNVADIRGAGLIRMNRDQGITAGNHHVVVGIG